MIASEAAMIASIFLTASTHSILEMISMCPPCSLIRARIASTSSARWMKEAATKSISCSIPKMISFLSCSEIAGRPRDTPGAAARLRVLIGPSFKIVQTMSLPTISST